MKMEFCRIHSKFKFLTLNSGIALHILSIRLYDWNDSSINQNESDIFILWINWWWRIFSISFNVNFTLKWRMKRERERKKIIRFQKEHILLYLYILQCAEWTKQKNVYIEHCWILLFDLQYNSYIHSFYGLNSSGLLSLCRHLKLYCVFMNLHVKRCSKKNRYTDRDSI